MDEGHEVLANPRYLYTLDCFASDFRWHISGTPFPAQEVMNGVLKYLKVKTTDDFSDDFEMVGDVGSVLAISFHPVAMIYRQYVKAIISLF